MILLSNGKRGSSLVPRSVTEEGGESGKRQICRYLTGELLLNFFSLDI